MITYPDTPDLTPDARETGRLEAFSDGVFAIAITLLVLDIHVPPLGNTPPGALVTALLEQWPSYLAFLGSFLTILIMWAAHHALFQYVQRVDHPFLIINGLLLLGITLVPFPTRLLAEYIPRGGFDLSIAAALYSGLSVFIALGYNLLWWWASHNHHLVDRNLTPAFLARFSRGYGLGPVVYSVATLLAFISVPLSVALYIGLALFYALPPGPTGTS